MSVKDKLAKFLYPYWALCFLLTHLPPPSVPSAVSNFDKLAHGLGYFCLAFLVQLKGHVTLKGLLLILVYAFFDELTQPLMGRSFEFSDLLSDAIGSALGFFISWKIFPGRSVGQSQSPQ